MYLEPALSSGEERVPCMHSRDKTVELNTEGEGDMMAGYAVEYSVEFVLKLVVETVDLIKVFGTNFTVYS